MATIHLKHSARQADESTEDVSERVSSLLAGLRVGREAKAVELAREFDGWEGPIVVDLDFTAQEPIPQEAVRRVADLLSSGKLFRYGEGGPTKPMLHYLKPNSPS